MFPAHPTVLSLCSAAFRCAALRRGAPTSRFRVGRRRVSAPFRSAPGKNGCPISLRFVCGRCARFLRTVPGYVAFRNRVAFPSGCVPSTVLRIRSLLPSASLFLVEQEFLYCSQRSQSMRIENPANRRGCCYSACGRGGKRYPFSRMRSSGNMISSTGIGVLTVIPSL